MPSDPEQSTLSETRWSENTLSGAASDAALATAPVRSRGPSDPLTRASRFAERLVALIEVVLCSGFPTQVLIIYALAAAGYSPFDARGDLFARYVIALSLLDATALISLILLFLKMHGERPRHLFLGVRPVGREVLIGVFLIPVVFFLVVTVLASVQKLFPSLHNVPHNPLEALIRTPRDAWLFGVVALAAGGLREEIQRAFILHRFEQHLGGAVFGLVLFSGAFGLGHAIQGWDAAIATALLGAVWGAIYLRRRTIVAPIVSHAGFDLAEIIRFTLFR